MPPLLPPQLPSLLPPQLPSLLPLLLALACTSAFAAAPDPDTNPELQRAARLRDEAQTLRTQAEVTFATEERKCYERFLVNHCIDKAKGARLATVRKARALEAAAHDIELAEKQRLAAESGRTHTDAPTTAAAPASEASFSIQPDPMADSTRRQREADAVRAQQTPQAEQQRKDAAKAQARAKTEAEAARRSEAAARDRARYDARIRKHEAEKAEEATQDDGK